MRPQTSTEVIYCATVQLKLTKIGLDEKRGERMSIEREGEIRKFIENRAR